MVALPPGTLLQLMYLRERIILLPRGHFVEVGPGAGEISNLLLKSGWIGAAYDLDSTTIERLTVRFKNEIASGLYKLHCKSFVESGAFEEVDLVISCMVIEHLDEREEFDFMSAARKRLGHTGLMIGIVPASPRHWGIEDDIAGHFRRYTRRSIADLCRATDWNITHMTGLTFPVSNILLPVANFLVARAERQKLAFSMLERTKQSGRREVQFKTNFPSVFGLLLNEWTMWPLHILQKWLSRSESALVLYFEATPGRAR